VDNAFGGSEIDAAREIVAAQPDQRDPQTRSAQIALFQEFPPPAA
jgi:hypothetical protein